MEMTSSLMGLVNSQRKKKGAPAETKEIFIKPIYFFYTKSQTTFDFYQRFPTCMMAR